MYDTVKPVDTVYRCRCGFIGETAKEVHDHQHAEMEACHESDCSGRIGECTHCNEIAAGDAIEEPVVLVEGVRNFIDSRETVGYYYECPECGTMRTSEYSHETGCYLCDFSEDMKGEPIVRKKPLMKAFGQKTGGE